MAKNKDQKKKERERRVAQKKLADAERLRQERAKLQTQDSDQPRDTLMTSAVSATRKIQQGSVARRTNLPRRMGGG